MWKEIDTKQADALWKLDVPLQFKAEGLFDWTAFPVGGEWSPSKDAESALSATWQQGIKSMHHRVWVE